MVKATIKATLLTNPSPQYVVGMDGRFQFVPLVMMPIQMQVRSSVRLSVSRKMG